MFNIKFKINVIYNERLKKRNGGEERRGEKRREREER
jgi:hypothetical protein